MFIDIHAHVYKYQYPCVDGRMMFITLDELLPIHDNMGIEKAILLPVVSSETYMPQSVGEIIDIANKYNDRFIPYCNVDPRVYSNTSDAPIGILLEYYKSLGCKGIGEVMPNLPWLDERFQNLLRHVERIGFPLIFDMTGSRDTAYGIYDDPGMPQLEACLNKFPDLLFVGHGPAFWSEIAELKAPNDRYGYPSYPVEKEGRVAYLLRTYPNLMAELSAGSGANALTRDPEYAVSFLNEFRDRIMFGTDICTKDEIPGTSEFLSKMKEDGKISHETFTLIAKENAIRLLRI